MEALSGVFGHADRKRLFHNHCSGLLLPGSARLGLHGPPPLHRHVEDRAGSAGAQLTADALGRAAPAIGADPLDEHQRGLSGSTKNCNPTMRSRSSIMSIVNSTRVVEIAATTGVPLSWINE